jgi:glycosyltransferase involved in cell wall biosynthesis
MKMIYIANARIPTEKAHGIQIMQMCQSFASNIEVELVAPQRFNYIKKDPFEYYGIERNFKIKKLPCLDLIVLYKYIGHLGFWIESATFYFFVFLYVFSKKADIIYTRDKLLLPLVILKKNLIYEAHTFPRHYFLYSLFFKRLKKIVVITQKLKDLFMEKGIPSRKILVVPDGVDFEKFNVRETREQCRSNLNLPPDKKIVLYTGHLYEWKGAQVLAEASQYLSKDVEIYFVGGTNEDIKKFKEFKEFKGFKIQVVGHIPHSEIPYWLKAADVLVLPNSGKQEISKHWTSPLKLFEYMAANKPIVASDLPSIREILNEKNSVLVKPDDSKELAKGITRALKDKILAEKISARAYENVKEYTWDKRVKKILEFLGSGV